MGSVWDEKPTVSGNKVILTEAGESFRGQVRERTQVYVDRFKKDVPAIVFEDGSEEGKIFEAGLTVWHNALLRLQPEPGDWLEITRGENTGSYTKGDIVKVSGPSDGQTAAKPKAAAKPVVNQDEPPF